mmetsp:Transcript_19562/g.63511  ORF Transcript_19562/g.63511 Transcript_19562/m.63511 type:complete len:381 (-) Transcript_19562:101-1243(-)
MPPKRGAAERGAPSKQPRGGRRDEDEELFGGTGGDSLGIQTGVTDITSQADEVDGWLDALDGLTKGKREAREAFLSVKAHIERARPAVSQLVDKAEAKAREADKWKKQYEKACRRHSDQVAELDAERESHNKLRQANAITKQEHKLLVKQIDKYRDRAEAAEHALSRRQAGSAGGSVAPTAPPTPAASLSERSAAAANKSPLARPSPAVSRKGASASRSDAQPPAPSASLCGGGGGGPQRPKRARSAVHRFEAEPARAAWSSAACGDGGGATLSKLPPCVSACITPVTSSCERVQATPHRTKRTSSARAGERATRPASRAARAAGRSSAPPPALLSGGTSGDPSTQDMAITRSPHHGEYATGSTISPPRPSCRRASVRRP